MNYELRKVSLEEKEVLGNLLQYYIYDFSEFMDLHFEANGKFGDYPLGEYWTDESRFPYFIMFDGKHAGFVLVKRINGESGAFFSIAEFFIAKTYRMAGLGKRVAASIFDLHRGSWEVYQINNNNPAQHFWRKAIAEYTGGQYTERLETGRITQVFVSGSTD